MEAISKITSYQNVNQIFEEDTQSPTVEQEEVVFSSQTIVQGSPDQDAIKKDYDEANAIESALQQQIKADKARTADLIQQMRSSRADIVKLEEEIKNLPEGPKKQEAEAALKVAKEGFGKLENDYAKMQTALGTLTAQEEDITQRLVHLLSLSHNPNPSAEDVALAHKYLKEVKEIQTSATANQSNFLVANQDSIIEQQRVIDQILNVRKILRSI